MISYDYRYISYSKETLKNGESISILSMLSGLWSCKDTKNNSLINIRKVVS